MTIDLGLPPIAILLIAALVVSIISDFLLEHFSVRMSLSTGRLQTWLFDHFGQNLIGDFLVCIVFQFFSFRKKAYFVQLASLVNVGSFSSAQIVVISLGSFVGIGLSVFLLMGGHLYIAGALCLVSLALSFWSKDQLRDMSFAFLALALLVTTLVFFNQYIESTTWGIRQFQISDLGVLVLIVGASVLFRTPVAFLIIVSLLHFFIGLNLIWLPALFFLNSVITLLPFYALVFKKWTRLYFLQAICLTCQIFQWLVATVLVFIFRSQFSEMLATDSFFTAYQTMLVAYVLFMAGGLLLVCPMFFVIARTRKVKENGLKKVGSQKIINITQRGMCFSIHLSLFLLRQEFKKFATSVHTAFKISRETDHSEEQINQRFARYQGMLHRVGSELKELCFSIGRQRSYRWQVKEVMSYYRIVNQLELLVEDLNQIVVLLRQPDIDEDWQRECQYWLGLQLKLFEFFFERTLGVEEVDSEKFAAGMQKSYDFLNKFLSQNGGKAPKTMQEQTFYRITESIGNLAL